jgi:hypothetical protein
MSLGRAIYLIRKSTGDDRFDVLLPYGNKLVLLRRGPTLWARLLITTDGRLTFVTPKLPLTYLELNRLLNGIYAEVNLGAVELSSQPRELIIRFKFLRIPVANSVWQPVARLALG